MTTNATSWLAWSFAALLIAALLWRALSRSDEPARLLARWIGTLLACAAGWLYVTRVVGVDSRGDLLVNFATAVFLVAGIAGVGVILAAIWRTKFGEWLALPLVHLFDGGSQEIEPAPLYSTAEARRKQGKPTEAIAEIERQLARFPGDFQGTLMVADIQAVDLHNPSAAEATLRTWMNSASRDPGQVAITLHRLAEWQLHLNHEPEQARATFEEIRTRFPDSEAAFLAEQRLAHLAAESAPKRGPIPLPEGLGHPVDTGVPPPVAEPPQSQEAAELVRHLAQHPHDIAARERLVQIYAWHYRRPDLARTELESLLQTKHAPPRETARWFNLLADIEIQLAADLHAARTALQRLIDRNPNAAAAEIARHRIHLLQRELSRHEKPLPLHLEPWKPPEDLR